MSFYKGRVFARFWFEGELASDFERGERELLAVTCEVVWRVEADLFAFLDVFWGLVVWAHDCFFAEKVGGDHVLHSLRAEQISRLVLRNHS